MKIQTGEREGAGVREVGPRVPSYKAQIYWGGFPDERQ